MPLYLLAPLLLAQSLGYGGTPGTPSEGPAQSVGAMRAGTAPRHVRELPETSSAPSRLDACLNAVSRDPAGAEATARTWLKEARGSYQALPELCLGSAYSAEERWDEAEKSFLAGREFAATSDRVLRAQLGAMAGNSELAAGAPALALPLFDGAHSDAQAAGQTHLAGDIAIDRARALVALKRDGDAAAALIEARDASPNNGLGWLLSATLSRRMGKLTDAQAQIETAAQLLPQDPDVGLEAGVIAVLSGRKPAAAKSWQSVIAATPRSPQADVARGYLAQLGPVAADIGPERRAAPAGSAGGR